MPPQASDKIGNATENWSLYRHFNMPPPLMERDENRLVKLTHPDGTVMTMTYEGESINVLKEELSRI